MTCAVCKREDRPDMRIVVRDDYDQVCGTFSAPYHTMTPEESDRLSGLLQGLEDRGRDPYRQIECRDCRREIAQQAAEEADAYERERRIDVEGD